MSAFYSFIYPDCVQLLTDGGFFDAEGILRRIERKVITFPNHPMAITWRSADAAQGRIIIADFGEFIDGYGYCETVDAILMFAREFFKRLSSKGPLDVEFLIAAFSETNGPCHFIVQCHGRWNIPSFELVSPGVQVGGGPAISFEDLKHLNLSAADVASPSFPELYGVDVIGAMRAKQGHIPGCEKQFYGVGGVCDLTTVRVSGASTKRLCQWSDEVGNYIDPARGLLQPSNEVQ